MTPRLRWLIGVVALLAVVRWAFPPGATADGAVSAVVPAIERPSAAVPTPAVTAPVAPGLPTGAEIDDMAGDAFAVRVPPAPPPELPPPPAPRKTKAQRLAEDRIEAPPPPPPPPPPAPPLQVIGTWDDAKAPGVFVATPNGTVLARVGTVLLSEYRVTALTAHQISLTHVASQHPWQLPVPRASARP